PPAGAPPPLNGAKISSTAGNGGGWCSRSGRGGRRCGRSRRARSRRRRLWRRPGSRQRRGPDRVVEEAEEVGIGRQHQPRIARSERRLIRLQCAVEGEEIRVLAERLG